jgi:2-oxoglutarate ferredoxin oxidoreductase subunit alpha
VVEQNRDGQLRTLLGAELPIDARKLTSILFYGGFPLSARYVVDGVIQYFGASSVQAATEKSA